MVVDPLYRCGQVVAYLSLIVRSDRRNPRTLCSHSPPAPGCKSEPNAKLKNIVSIAKCIFGWIESLSSDGDHVWALKLRYFLVVEIGSDHVNTMLLLLHDKRW